MNLAELYDIYGIWHIPWWQGPLFVYVLIGFVAIILGILLFFFIKRLRRKRELTFWEKALRNLDQLQYVELSDKEFYAALTMILKQYFHERFEVKLLDKTDQELILILEQMSIPPEVVKPISHLFTAATAYKFWLGSVDHEQRKEDYAQAIMAIKQTIPVQK